VYACSGLLIGCRLLSKSGLTVTLGLACVACVVAAYARVAPSGARSVLPLLYVPLAVWLGLLAGEISLLPPYV
jgi:hypothetical protein